MELRVRICVGFLLLVFISPQAFASAIREETNQSVQIQDETPKWFTDTRAALSYRLASDLNDAQRPRRFDHLIAPEVSTQVRDWFRASVGFTVQAYALGNNVPNEPDNPAGGDIFAGVMRPVDLGERHLLFLEQYGTLPTGGESRYQGYRGSSVSSARLTSFLWPRRLALINAARWTYIFNTYEFSPITRESSDEWEMFYSPALLFLATREFRISAGFTTSYTSQLNGSNRIRTGNAVSLTYVGAGWMAALSYANQSFVDDYRYDVLARDLFRQLVSMRVIYEY